MPVAQWPQCLVPSVVILGKKKKIIHLLHDMKSDCMVSASVLFIPPCLISAQSVSLFCILNAIVIEQFLKI